MARPRKPRVDSLATAARIARALTTEFGLEEAQRIAQGLAAEPRAAKLDLRISAARLARYRDAAQAAGLTLTAWVERACDAALEAAGVTDDRE